MRAIHGQMPNTAQMLIVAGADVRKANSYGVTALYIAARAGDSVATRMLLAAGADANAALPASGETVLMTAAKAGNTDVVRVYVLRDPDGQLLGFCGCWFVYDELHINTLAIGRPFRRRGHATRLLRFVLSEAAAAGIARATLEVRRSNDAALRLYDRFGFQVRGVRPDYYTEPVEDALILWSQNLGFLDSDTEP
jgi:ribosomal-protein-alanine acetyltransferase